MRAVPCRLLRAGEDLGRWVVDNLTAAAPAPEDGDVLVVAHKVVSLAEGRVVCLSEVTPSEAARRLASEVGKDPSLVELVLRESVEVVRKRPGLLVARHRLGFVCANAGLDQSNAGPDVAVLLPENPDASARRIREALRGSFGRAVGVVVANELASAATLLMGQADEGRPLVLIRGWPAGGEGSAQTLVRPPEGDLFR